MKVSAFGGALRRWRDARRTHAVARTEEARRARASLAAWRHRFRPERHMKGWEDKPPPPTGLSI